MVVVAAALLTLAFLSRTQAVTVQDRVIRLEMRLRLRQMLPPELHGRIQDLTHRQLVALRFASDAELPGLVREILDGKLTTGKEIKLRVKNWQGGLAEGLNSWLAGTSAPRRLFLLDRRHHLGGEEPAQVAGARREEFRRHRFDRRRLS